MTLAGTVIEVRPKQYLNASHPIPVTGLPLINGGMTSAPPAVVLQSVMVTDDDPSR